MLDTSSEASIPEVRGQSRKKNRPNPEPETDYNADDADKLKLRPNALKFSQLNQECLVGVFMDPETNCESVAVLYLLPSGVDTASVSIPENNNGSSRYIEIEYDWPQPMYDMDFFFREDLQKKTFQTYHPLIQCLHSELRRHRTNVDEQPESCVRVNLPIPVQSDTSSYTHRIDAFTMESKVTAQVLFVRMKAFQTSYAIGESAKKVKAVFR